MASLSRHGHAQQFLTADQPGIGGRLKVEPADFFVEEIPLYAPSGEGSHVYVTVEKTGISTYAAIKQLAQALSISPNAIGYAGLKDAQAVTRQTLSIESVAPETIAKLSFPNIQVLEVTRHTNKLKAGHLSGNRFRIRVRGVEPKDLPQAEAILETLIRRGVPNFFDTQRFGTRGNTDRLGEAIVRRDSAEFVAEFLGRPQAHEMAAVQAGRQLVDAGRWAEALAVWPQKLADERRALTAISQAHGELEGVFKVLNKKLKIFFVSAFQSLLFNQLLTDRLETLDKLEPGDVAYLHRKGASFIVEDVAAEQPRADQFEISPSGPIFGSKSLLAQHEPGRRERAKLAEYRLVPDDFNLPGLKIRGTRRPYRFPVKAGTLEWNDGLRVSFELPAGAYATRVMAEIMKN
jgi:tRNA pseudouridine13 synthase